MQTSFNSHAISGIAVHFSDESKGLRVLFCVSDMLVGTRDIQNKAKLSPRKLFSPAKLLLSQQAPDISPLKADRACARRLKRLVRQVFDKKDLQKQIALPPTSTANFEKNMNVVMRCGNE